MLCFSISCDNSFLAKDTTVKFIDEYGKIKYDMCCKKMTRKDKQHTQDFYCLMDKGGAEGNEDDCLRLADNPSAILGLKPADNHQMKNEAPPLL